MSLTTRLLLARWLGPWAGGSRVPRVEREERFVPASEGRPPMRAFVYRPAWRRPIGAYLIAPGLHYLGPEDPRMDRFLRVLAHAGLFVYAPFLPDYLALRVRESATVDLGRALDAMLLDGWMPRAGRPGVFSVSFGSLPALRLAVDERWGSRVGSLVLFGGYADFRDVIRFSLTPPSDRAHDPLNKPVVLMNLLQHMEGLPAGVDDVVAAWERYVRRVWGRPEMREDERFVDVAREEGRQLGGAELALYEEGIGLRPGALDRCLAALDVAGEAASHLDPRSGLMRLFCPVHLFHGADDDVIPYEQMDLLYAALPPHVKRERYLTGLYHHTGASGGGGFGAQVAEGKTLVRMLDALVQSSRG